MRIATHALTSWSAGEICAMSNTIPQKIGAIADRGIDQMVSEVQSILGVTSGDVAAQHFSGGHFKTTVVLGLMDYVITEMQMQLDELEGAVQPWTLPKGALKHDKA
jgi:hypothetical protein